MATSVTGKPPHVHIGHGRSNSNASVTSNSGLDPGTTDRFLELCQLTSYLNTTSEGSSNHLRQPPISIDALFDSVFALFEDLRSACSASSANSQNPLFESFIKKYDQVISKIQMLRQNKNDFEILKKLGKGAFGEVHLVRSKLDGKIYAMKILKKSEMLRQLEERNLLTISKDSQWLISCICSFQDDQNLYLVMEFIPGGDLMSLLCRREDGTFDEDTARFYIAEIIMAVSELHSYNFVHRDIKPDNVLLDAKGHIKLADFGSCIALNSQGLVTSSIAVGTPDYISPEILRAQEGNVSYGKECDWWSVGIVLFEVLFGEPPFYADTLLETYGKIMNHSKHFKLPGDIDVSEECKDLLKKLVCVKENRLGKDGLGEIKSHPFFKSIDWDTLRHQTPPFVPKLKSEDDTSMFELPEEDGGDERSSNADLIADVGKKPNNAKGVYTGNQLPFIGFSFHGNRFALTPINSHSASAAGGMRRSKTQLSSLANSMLNNPQSHADDDNSRLLKSTNAKLELQIQNLLTDLTSLKSKLVTASSEKEALYKSLEQAEHVKISLESENASKSQKFDEEKRDLKQQLEIISKEKSNFSYEIENLKRDFNELQNNFSQEKRNHADALERIRFLESEARDANTKMKELQLSSEESMKKYKARETAFQEQIREHQKIAKERDETIEALSAQIKSHSDIFKDKLETENQLLLSQSEASQLKIEVSSLQIKVSNLQSEEERLQRQIQEISDSANIQSDARLAESETHRKLMAEQVVELSKQIEVLNINHESFMNQVKREKTELNAKINQLQATLNTEIEKRKTLESSLNQKEKELSNIQGELEESKGNLEKFRKQKSDLQQKYSEETANLLKKVSEAQNSRDVAVKKFQEESVGRKRAESQSESSLKGLHGKVVEISAERDQLQTSLTQLQTISRLKEVELQSVKQNLQREKKLTDSLQLEISEWKHKLESENKSRILVNQELEVIQAQLQDSRRRNEDLMEEMRIEAETLANLEESYEKLKKKSELDSLKISELVRKMESEMLMGPRASASSVGSILSSPTSLLFSPKVDSDKKILKQKQNDIKKLEQRLLQEQSLRKSLELEIQELRNGKSILEKEISQFVKQGSSTSSAASSKRGSVSAVTGNILRRISNAAASAQSAMVRSIDDILGVDSTNLSDSITLEGWIKIPKIKGIRSGWTKYYAVVRDFSFIILEREKDKDSALNDGKILFNIRSEAFSVRPAFEKELVHVTPRECSCILQVKWSGGTLVSTHSALSNNDTAGGNADHNNSNESINASNLKESARRIKQLEKEILVEEKLYKGAEALARISTGNQRLEAEKQMEGSLKRMANLKSELEKLRSIERIDQALSAYDLDAIGTGISDEESMEKLSQLEKELQKEESCRDAILKIIAVTDSKKRNDLQKQLHACQKNIQNIKSDIESLNVGKKQTGNISNSKQDLGSKGNINQSNNYEFNGHTFKTRTFTVPTACQQCHDTLWGFSGQGVECINCRFICHKNCYTLVSSSCAETSLLRSAKPLYIMAMDEVDRGKWVQGLEIMRKIAVSKYQSATVQSHCESIGSHQSVGPTSPTKTV